MKTVEDLLQEAGEIRRKLLELPEGSRPSGFVIKIPDSTTLEEFKKILAAFAKTSELKCTGTQDLTMPGTFLLFNM